MSITKHESTELALADEQVGFTDRQRSALEHIGVENATDGDLQVFFHVCKRTGLDPFARQIHMIGRNAKDQRTNQWITKFTIQTGIDGFRLIGRRAANARNESVSLAAPQWAHEDGSWRDVWSPKWGHPLAARVTLTRAGDPFVAVALFDEYKQTKRDGGLTSMWSGRPAGQLAKCAEALAWRMAFPQDLSGIYADDEMHQADRVEERRAPQAASVDQMRAALSPNPSPAQGVRAPESPETVDQATTVEASAGEDLADVTEADLMLNPRSGLAKAMFAAMGEHGYKEKPERLDYCTAVTGREIASSSDLTEAEARKILADLDAIANGTEPATDVTE